MRSLGILSSLVLCLLGALAAAGDTEHYVNGVEGLSAASVPPPGIYYRNYEVWYHSTELKDHHGNSVPLGFDLDVVASVHRGIWITDRIKDIIGCDFGMHALVPVIYEDVRLSRLGVDDNRTRVGDLMFSPVLLSWHKKRFDLSFDYELYMPTADRHEPATPGKEFWTHLCTFGGTAYIDEAKTWTFSLLSRYEIHSEQHNTHVTPGNDFHFEWGAGKSFKQGFQVGAVGYCQWRVTNDSGSGATDFSRNRVYAAGVEGNYMIKAIGLHTVLRWEKEFLARNRPEGMITTLNFNKRF